MSKAPPDKELQEFFEEVWRLAELAAESEDRHLAPHLFALAEELAWGGFEPDTCASDLSVAGPEPHLVDASQGFRQGTALQDHNLDGGPANLAVMAARLARQRTIVSRMECIGSRQCIELAYQVLQTMQNSLQAMQDSMEIARYGHALRAAVNDRPNSSSN